MADADSKYHVEPIAASATPWQSLLAQRLVELQRRQELPHALLINPRTAVDCQTFGWYLAKSLLCQDDASSTPCGRCNHCQLMQANTYPDFSFTTLVPNERTHKLNRDIKIEQIRRLIYHLSLTSSESAGKVALLYPAERMNVASANSLLKTLEEPADGSTLILLTRFPGRLPITIRSRCQQWAVERPAHEQARSWMLEHGLPEAAIDNYLKLAAGDAELALELFASNAQQHLEDFQQALKQFLGNRSTVMQAVDSLKGLEDDLVRLIVGRVLQAFVYQQVQLGANTEARQRLQQLLDLMQKADFVLHSVETNLILQLQLEDVLISLKQILTGETLHGRTRQPGHTVT